jgi:hypothetical protein
LEICVSKLPDSSRDAVDKEKERLRGRHVDELRRMMDPAINSPEKIHPALKRALQELIEEQQLDSISPRAKEILYEEDPEHSPAMWRRLLRKLSDAGVLTAAFDVDYVSDHRWAGREAEVEVDKRRGRREGFRYWITTTIAIIALLISIASYDDVKTWITETLLAGEKSVEQEE